MDIIALLIIALVVIVAVIIIDKTFTGPAAEFAWLAKIAVGIIGLVFVLEQFGITNF